MVVNMWQKNIGLGIDMYDIEEIRLARALGLAIQEELNKGNELPKEIMDAYKQLHIHWQWQITRELS